MQAGRFCVQNFALAIVAIRAANTAATQPKGAFPLEIGEKDADFSRREVKSALRIRV